MDGVVMERTRNIPTVFVSSTCYDLSQVREDLKDFFEDNYGFNALLSEFDSFQLILVSEHLKIVYLM